LRRHNFVGFAGEVLKGVIREKVNQGGYDAWIEQAKSKTKARMEEGRRKGGDEEMTG